jgi:hypothetical protein
MNDLFTEKLEWFKQNEKPEVVLLIADLPECIKFVIAWTNIKMRRADNLTELVSTSESEIWEWLWNNTIYYRSDLTEKIGISFSDLGVENQIRPLIGNRILYLDGTVNSYVQRYLREKVITLFDNKSRKIARKTE